MKSMQLIQSGNTAKDSTETRGWFVGHFIERSLGLRHSDDVELKWGTHSAGEARTEWVTGESRITIALLISGKFEVEFRDQTVTLSKPGDYAMWDRGVDHKWRVVEDAVILTIRWPSLPDDNKEIERLGGANTLEEDSLDAIARLKEADKRKSRMR